MEKFLEEFAEYPLLYKVGGVFAAVLLIVGMDYTFYVSDLQTSIEEHRVTNNKKAAELRKLQEQAANLTKFKREVERLKQRLREAEEQLPKTAEVPRLLREIAYEAQQSGLELKKFTLTDEERKESFASVPVQMSVRGGYHELAVFFDRLSKMSRIVNISDVTMRMPQMKNKKIVLSASFIATTYRFIEKSK